MNQDSVNIKEIIEFGLEKIDPNRMVSVNLRDLVYIHKVLQEYMDFFHQPLHWQELSDIDSFMGNIKSGGAFEVLHTALYKKSYNMLPKDIEKLFDNDDLTHPKFPNHKS